MAAKVERKCVWKVANTGLYGANYGDRIWDGEGEDGDKTGGKNKPVLGEERKTDLIWEIECRQRESAGEKKRFKRSGTASPNHDNKSGEEKGICIPL